jgi:hypothetical protein
VSGHGVARQHVWLLCSPWEHQRYRLVARFGTPAQHRSGAFWVATFLRWLLRKIRRCTTAIACSYFPSQNRAS